MKIKICVASMNVLAGDWSGQMVLLRQAIEAAKKANAKLLVLPELVIGGPDAGDILLRGDTAAYAEQVLAEIVPQTRDLTVICGTPLAHGGTLYNVAAVLTDGRIAAFVPKRYPDTACDEDRWFGRWDMEKSELHLGALIGRFNQTIPGLENLDICMGNIAFHPAPQRGATVVEVSNRAFAPNLYRDELSYRLDYSRKYGVTLVRANMLGSDDGTHIYDGGGFIVSRGQMAALSRRFVMDEGFDLTFSDDELASSFDPSLAHLKKSGTCPQSADDYAYAEIELALALGINDYMKRANVQRLCLALSGGRDSAMIAVIVARMAALKNPGLDENALREKVRELLYCAYLPSCLSSSSGTQKAALALAQKLGMECPIIPIGDLSASCTDVIEKTTGRKLTWDADDLTLQNVQARTRSLVIWTLANAHQAMLLTTGNMSEAAVGYATMDGDSSGCLDPIGNLPKTLVNRWLEWARKFHNLAELDLVFAQPPSAELRPLETQQSDEADLMPYPVLDAYIEWFMVRRMTPLEIYKCAKSQLAQYYEKAEDIQRDIRKFVGMATRSQWKRVRFANSFKVLPFDIGPMDGLRWPCLQAPFTRACDEL